MGYWNILMASPVHLFISGKAHVFEYCDFIYLSLARLMSLNIVIPFIYLRHGSFF